MSVIGRVMERCVCKHIHNYLLENNIVISNQSGFTYLLILQMSLVMFG